MTPPLRLAMWSGPRNISTAMMRAWENREDTVVWDEPLYAYYLKQGGADHPAADEVIAAGEPDWRKVVRALDDPLPCGKSILFQKHMTHHLLDGMCWDWLGGVTSFFLIRDPRRVVASYARSRPGARVSAHDVGIPQQARIFDYIRMRTGRTPAVVDSDDVLKNPRSMLVRLCAELEVAFSERMLSWPAGPRNSDGVWAVHWYDSVWRSTGFAPYQAGAVTLNATLESVAAECMPHYQTLHAERLRLT